jgi:endonuclease/exonuclease/phosphatase family metal-dependent hydrolase
MTQLDIRHGLNIFLAVVWLLPLAACSDDLAATDAGYDSSTDDADASYQDGDQAIPGDADADSQGDPSLDDGDSGPIDAADDQDVFDGGDEPGDAADGQGDAADGDGAGDPGQTATFKVLTINLKHPLTGMDEALVRLQIVADVINQSQPDVVALQEVVQDGEDPSLAEQLAGLTGYEWFWQYTYTVPLLFNEGIGVLSRWPIVWTDATTLPHLDLVIFTRQVIGARVDSPYGEIQLFCTHMTTDSDETIKADQALAVYEFIQANPSTRAGFLAGDLNAEPDTLAMRFFRGEAEHEGVTGNLIDAWAAINPGQDGFTIPSNAPDRRIDYIYVIPGTQTSASVDSCEVMFSDQVDGLYASDHLGVMCSFTLPN